MKDNTDFQNKGSVRIYVIFFLCSKKLTVLRSTDGLVRAYSSDRRGREDMTHPEVVLEKNLIKGNQRCMAESPGEVGAHSAPGGGDWRRK